MASPDVMNSNGFTKSVHFADEQQQQQPLVSDFQEMMQQQTETEGFQPPPYSAEQQPMDYVTAPEVPVTEFKESQPLGYDDTHGSMEAPFVETQHVHDLAYSGSTGPDIGVHTMGFRRSKFAPTEWHEANYSKYYNAFSNRDAAERSRHEAERVMHETDNRTMQNQKTSTDKAGERLHDIEFWKHELEREVEDIIEETDMLKAQKRRCENALRTSEIPLHIATDNLNCRRRRRGVDLVQDNVELALLKEVEIINNVQDLLRKTIAQADLQIAANRDAKTQLEMDWSDKKEEHELDVIAASLRNDSTNKQLYPGSAVFQQVQSTPESWAQFSHDNIVNGENERMASIQLRTLIDNLLQDTSRDMREQADAVDTALQLRISEVEDAKEKMIDNLKKLCTAISQQERKNADLQAAIKAKEDPLKVATTRLETRSHRPGVSLCRDDAQYQLIGEVKELQQSIDELKCQLADSVDRTKELMDTRMQLELELSNKKNTIFVDREKCLNHRSRYPTTLRLQGFNQ